MSTNRTYNDVQLYINFNTEITGAAKQADSVLYSNLDPTGVTNMAIEMAKIYTWAHDVFTFTPSGTKKITINSSVLPETSDTTYSFREGSIAGSFQVQENDEAWQTIAIHSIPTLDSNGKILETFLPSYVDDVVEGYYYEGKFYTTAAHTTEIPAETGKIYVDIPSNTSYRYGGTTYVLITNPVDIMTGATASSDGVAGLVPAPRAGDQSKFLRADGTWVTPVAFSRSFTSGTNIGEITINGTGTNIYIPDMSAATASTSGSRGTVQPPVGAQTKYLRGDNTWVDPLDDIGTLTLHCTNGTT